LASIHTSGGIAVPEVIYGNVTIFLGGRCADSSGVYSRRCSKAIEVTKMNSTPSKGRAARNRVIEQLMVLPPGSRSEAAEPAETKSDEIHTSTTIIQRIANARRGYLTWLALQAAAIAGKEPAIDSEADASWRAR
jgi:hypothetical protein